VQRVTLYHRTALENLPLIEVDGLRTRVDLSKRLGPLGTFDLAATGRYSRGRRVSGWVSAAATGAMPAELGAGLVSFTVDPRKAVANRASERRADPEATWSAIRPLAAWLEEASGDLAALPEDLEAHVELPVRAKLVRIHAPDLTAEDLGGYAGVVTHIADTDRVASKLLMHLALAVADGDAQTSAYRAACALAWRDEADARDIAQRVARADAEAVLEAVLADLEDVAPEGAAALLGLLDTLRAEADTSGADLGQLMMDRSERSLVSIISR
jgi:hypothetical protein